MRVHFALPSALTAITRSVTVAAGRFAPGHLGELTAVVPFEVDDAVDPAAGHGLLHQGPGGGGSESEAPELGSALVTDLDDTVGRGRGEAT